MTLTIELTPEVEEPLKNRAKASGFEEVSEYAKKVLEDDTNKMRTIDEILAPFREHTEQIPEEEIDDLVKKLEEKFLQRKRRNKNS